MMGRKHDCLNDCWDLRKTVLELFNLMEDRIGDVEKALKAANVTIPHGASTAERERRIAEGMKLLGLEEG